MSERMRVGPARRCGEHRQKKDHEEKGCALKVP
jgi:hypothetical protein